MHAWASSMMKMGFVVVPLGTDPEGSTTKAYYKSYFHGNLFKFQHRLNAQKDSFRMTFNLDKC